MPKQFKTRKELQEQLNQWDEFVKKYDADKENNDKEVSGLDKRRASLQSLIEKENINLGNESNLFHASEKEIEKKEATVSGEYAASQKKIDGKIRPNIEEMKQIQRDEQ